MDKKTQSKNNDKIRNCMHIFITQGQRQHGGEGHGCRPGDRGERDEINGENRDIIL